ncbi:MAG: TFIIB-type zinc ribbon-containing protein [Lachnospiraceae bacterium]|nr:TFIIB-type zinc ribbon-containing protein [Lachnospiraceae bacterium]
MYQCKNCNGKLFFDIKEQMLTCESCGSYFDLSEYNEEAMTAEGSYEINTFLCPQCNGEIISADEQATEICPYCGSQVELEKHLVTTKKPRYILPFTVSRAECRKTYKKTVSKIPFLPKDMKNPDALGNFAGIYMPFWLYNIQIGGHIAGKGHETHYTKENKKEYVITNQYEKEFDYVGDFTNYPKDASLCFDDNLTERILPYTAGVNALEDFHPAYLCGFYGDLATVPEETYQDTILNEIVEYGIKNGTWNDLDRMKPKELRAHLEEAKQHAAIDANLGMFPVWFMTYRNKNKVSYGVANGRTGALSMDFPVDLKAFFLSTILLAVPIFLASLLWLPSFPIKVLNQIAWLLSLISMLAAGIMQGKRYIRNQMIRQKTSFSIWEFKKAHGSPVKGVVILLLLFFFFPELLLLLEVIGVLLGGARNVLLFLPILLLVYALIRYPKRMNAAVLTAFLSAIVTALIHRLDPPQDLYYYGAVLFAGFALIGTLLLMVRIQKEFAERKLPFFERGELQYND